MSQLYSYVGPASIRDRVADRSTGTIVATHADLTRWVHAADGGESIVATFVIDADGRLRLADRRSEHVACAGGGPVLSAGEMFFRVSEEGIEVVEVSNQSTGFCPEPESWPSVAVALDRLGVPHSGRFTTAIAFRLCPSCGERNVVRDGWFVCGSCGADLPTEWNFV